MDLIEKNSFYSFRVDTLKNRIYMKVTGTWESVDQVPDFLTHLEQSLVRVSPGFSVISDIREMGECSLEVRELHIKAQKKTVAAGISQLAEIHKMHDPVSEQAIAMAYESKISLNIFENLEDADAWLNETL